MLLWVYSADQISEKKKNKNECFIPGKSSYQKMVVLNFDGEILPIVLSKMALNGSDYRKKTKLIAFLALFVNQGSNSNGVKENNHFNRKRCSKSLKMSTAIWL